MDNTLSEVAAERRGGSDRPQSLHRDYSQDLVIPNTADLGVTGELIKIKCPFCLKPQVKSHQNLICGPCTREELELVRNSVVENDQMNNDTRQEINEIFDIYESITQGKDVTEYSSRNKDKNIPYSTLRSIKILSLQLLKLEIINRKLKVKNIEKSQNVLTEKIDKLKENIAEKSQKLNLNENEVISRSHTLVQGFNKANDRVVSSIKEYRQEKNFQVEKQIYQSQLNHMRALNEIVFSKKKKHSSGSLMNRRSEEELLFFNQSILDISNFLHYNHKLVVINEFLENLIKLQVQLFEIIRITNSLFQFPYLNELVKYLPDKKFYNLVQEKENFMINGGQIDDTAPDEPAPYEGKEIDEEDNERIVKLGDAIKLPLSSKTINNQLRRASMITQPTVEMPPIRPLIEEKETAAAVAAVPKNSLKGKKVIIIPHKILTKPFTKATTDEYLKFLLVIVKIIVNFKTLFAFTIDKLPKNRALGTSKSISESIQHMRGNHKPADPSNELYDFQKILNKVLLLEKYFEIKLDMLKQNNKLPDSTSLATSQLSSRTISSKSSTSSLRDVKAPFLTFYSTFFREPPKTSTDANVSELTPVEKEIYGNVSGTHELGANSEHTSDSENEIELQLEAKSLPLSLYPSYKPKSTTSVSGKNNELKTIMQNVYRHITNGAARASETAKSPSTKLDINMMVQSKGQLDDWDLVSKMY